MLNLNSSPDRERVTITDIRIPFWSMVWLIFKASVASIPAAIMLFALFIALGLASVLLLGSFRSVAGSLLSVPRTTSHFAPPAASPTPWQTRQIEIESPTPGPAPTDTP